MEPVRVKLYGLFSLTRRRYLMQLVVGGVLMAVLLGLWLFHWLRLREQVRGLDLPSLDWVITLLDLTPWLVLIIALLQSIEAYVVLRAFARKQAASSPSQPPGPSQTPGEPGT